jgi:O-antigen ligase
MGEPVELLGRSYLNQAHNDWLQFLIEGGIGAIMLLAGGAIAAILQGRRLLKMHRLGAETQEAWLGLALLVVLGVASLVDYPLRVPSVMALAIIALAMFSGPGPRFRPATGRHQPDVNSGQQ